MESQLNKIKNIDVVSVKDGEDVVSEKDGVDVVGASSRASAKMKRQNVAITRPQTSKKGEPGYIEAIEGLEANPKSLSTLGFGGRQGDMAFWSASEASDEEGTEVAMREVELDSQKSRRVTRSQTKSGLSRLPTPFASRDSSVESTARKRKRDGELVSDSRDSSVDVGGDFRNTVVGGSGQHYHEVGKATTHLAYLEDNSFRLLSEDVASQSGPPKKKGKGKGKKSPPQTSEKQTVAEASVARLKKAMHANAMQLREAVRKCGNLKGASVKELKEGISSFEMLADRLGVDLIPTSMAPVLAKNQRLEDEVRELKRQVAEILEDRNRTANRRAAPPPPPPARHERSSLARANAPGHAPERDLREILGFDPDEFKAQILQSVGAAVNQRMDLVCRRFSGYNGPLASPSNISAHFLDVEGENEEMMFDHPEHPANFRPALRRDARIRDLASQPAAGAIKARLSAERQPNQAAGRVQQPQPTAVRPLSSQVLDGNWPSLPTILPRENPEAMASEETWTEVSRRRGRQTQMRDRQMTAKQHSRRAGGPAQQPQKNGGGKPSPAKLRAPRSAAVVLALNPEAEGRGVTYSQIIRETRSKISLPDMGIGGVRMKVAATGARIIEILGAENGGHADQLAERIRQVLPEDWVKVSRPCKTAEMRVLDLDDAVTPEEVAEAVAREGGCRPDEVRAGTIRRGPSGLGTCWVRGPVVAIKCITTAGRLGIGWVKARAELLRAQPLRCFRCLHIGHVRTKCTLAEDRSGLCFRCGEAGHKAAVCSAAPKCMLCSAAGRPANHRVGAKTCTPPQGWKRGPTMTPTAGPSQRGVQEAMELR